MKYDLINSELNPIEYILHLYDNNIMNRNNNFIYFYFLILNIKDNKNSSNKHFGYLFKNFNICLYIILKYINNISEQRNICNILVNSLFPKMNFCQYIILKIILGQHEIINEKFYAKIFTSFLNFVSVEKLMIADFYNLILFSINSEIKKIFAKSSILIKYKYSLLKQKFEENQNDLILKKKIFENISQFGKISKNYYFSKYIKDEIDNMKISIRKEDENIFENENIEQNELSNKSNNISNDNNNEGFFSSIKYAFGFCSKDLKREDEIINNNYEEKVEIYEDNN